MVKGFGRHARGAARSTTSSFVAPDGAITGLLGPNGAGKTTLLRMLATLIVAGCRQGHHRRLDVVRDRYEVRRRIGVLSDARGLYPRLTARENIALLRRAARPCRGARCAARVDALIDTLGIADLADRRTQGFSQGERMKVAIARALVHDPRRDPARRARPTASTS